MTNQAGERQRPARQRVRGLLRLATLVLIVCLVVWAGVRVAHATSSPAQVSDKVYAVRSGDTLWTIAVNHYGVVRDPRPLVYAIERHNHLTSASLTPGQVLLLPPLE